MNIYFLRTDTEEEMIQILKQAKVINEDNVCILPIAGVTFVGEIPNKSTKYHANLKATYDIDQSILDQLPVIPEPQNPYIC